MNETELTPPVQEQAESEKKLVPFFEAIAQEDVYPYIEQLPLPAEAKEGNRDRLAIYALIGYQEAVAASLARPLTDEEQDQTRVEFLEKMYDPNWMSSLEAKYPTIKESLKALFARYKEHTQRSFDAMKSS